ncbi:MAG TPA: sensor histidine kinase [Longimicrobiales bacterium]|nr:sensor histidine kinase [Longimicrobiales bacterium]
MLANDRLAAPAEAEPAVPEDDARRLGARIRDDMRDPLERILLFARRLAETGETNPAARAAAEAITRSAEDIVARLSRFEDVARDLLAESAGAQPPVEVVLPSGLAHTLAGELGGLARQIDAAASQPAGAASLQPRLKRAARLASLWLAPRPDAGRARATPRPSWSAAGAGRAATAPDAPASPAVEVGSSIAIKALTARLERLQAAHRALQAQSADRERRWRLRIQELRNAAHALLSWGFALRRSPLQKTPWFAPLLRATDSVLRRAEETLDAGEPPADLVVHVQEVDLGVAAQEAIEAIRPTADLCQLMLVLAGPPVGETVHVAADPDRVHQILQNLLRNAIDATPAGGSIAVSIHGDDDAGIVEVEDTGSGLPPEVFSTLSTDALEASDEVLGLGLAFSRELALRMGGRLSAAAPDLGDGARLLLRLPRTAS